MEIFSEKIILAREARGITQEELSRQLNITQGTLSKIEQDLQNISEELLKRLSEVLVFPIGFFSLPNKVHPPDIIYFRKRLSLPKKVIMKTEARMNIIRIVLERMLENVELPEKDILSWEVEENGSTSSAAQFLRNKWKVPKGRIDNLTNLLESKGILIIPLDFESKKIDGISMIAENGHPILFINSSMPSDRQRLSIAHELGHLVLHFGKMVTSDRDIEKEAFEFASEFLVPENEFKNLSSPIDLRFLANQKLYWKVSMASLLFRIKELRMATENQIRYLWTQMSSLGYKTSEPYENDILKENPTLVKDMVNFHLNDLEFTKDEISSFTNLYWDELESLLLPNISTNLRLVK